MTMQWSAVLLVACLVLAGCSGKDKDDEPTTTPTQTGTGSATSTSTGASAPATIEVVVNRTTPNGAAPLQVNFTLDATFRHANGTQAPTPALASWNVTVVAEAAGNATGNGTGASAGNVTQGPAGTTLPANVTLELNETGDFTVVATVSAPGFAPGNDSFIVAVAAGGAGPGGAALFFDGGETDESQWTLQSRVLITNTAPGVPEVEVPEDHPSGPWAITDAAARSGTHAWSTPYPDNYRTRMTSVPIPVPAGGATLSYWIFGGAEDTSFEGVFVLVGPADALVEANHNTGVFAEWTEFHVDLADFAGQDIVVQFRMDTDLSCSNDGPPDGTICGAGYDGGGLLLDDITVS